MGRKRNGEPSRMPISSTTATTSTKAMSITQGSLGSFL
jgi:hypothetical protein